MKSRSFRLWIVAVVLLGCIAPRNVEAAASPSITTQPLSQTNFFGSNVVFTVAASGQTPLIYQWLFDGTNLADNGHISGSTTTNLTINSITTSDAGNYRVIVSNSHGSATSSNATLTVLVPATITSQPTNESVLFGRNATFTAGASGTLPLAYQWYFNGTALSDGGRVSGSATASLNIINVQTNDGGAYQLVVTNNYGTATSMTATLTVLTPPSIVVEPANQTVVLSSNVSFVGIDTGTAPLKYQWYFNGAALVDVGRITGSTTTNLTIANVQTSDSGAYQLIVTNNYGSIASTGTLTVVVPAAITISPTNQSVLQSSNVIFTAGATGTAPLSYQWYFNGSPLVDGSGVNGSATADLNISNVQTNDAGSYQLVVTNNYGSSTSALATLTVLVPAAITMEPTNEVALVDRTTVFSAAGNGTGPLFYRWQKDGVDLADGGHFSGTASPALTISNILMSDIGNYSVSVSNLYGVASSTAAGLQVVPIMTWGGVAGSGGGNLTSNLTNTLAIALGDFDFGLALNNYGTVAGWGYSGNSQIDIPAGLSNVVAVSAGFAESLALMSDGTVVGWGNDGEGQTNPPPGLSNVVAVSAGRGYSLALKNDGTLAVWGAPAFQDNFGQTSLPPGLSNVVAIAAGNYHCLALKDDGTLVGWGYNAYGEATPPAGATDIVAVAAGVSHSLALKSDGTVIAWGNDADGQTNVPAELSNVVAIAAGASHNLALESDGTIVAWGDSNYSQTNVPSGLQNVVAVAANEDESVALVQNPTAPVPPTIWWQGMTNRIIAGGQPALFDPDILGSLPMSYQWYFNGAPLAGQTNQWLALPSLQPTQSGSYYFIVTNNYGSATSAPMSIAQSPAIVLQPTNESLILGNTAAFDTVVLGDAPLAYQWFFNGAPLADGGRINGSATPNLNIADVQASDAGNYEMVAINNYGSATSAVATLTVSIPATITSQPTNVSVLVNSNAGFSVFAIGTPPLSYLWYSNGIPMANGGRISGATSTNLTLSNVSTNDSGTTYDVVVTNNYGSATSAVATLTVITPVIIVGQPASQDALLAGSASFTVNAGGTGPFTYQWYFNDAPLSDGGRISGSAASALTISDVQSSDAGGYVVVVSNLLTSARSLTASLTPEAVLSPSTRYVSLTSTNPQPPYLNWSTAATNIQDAVDAAVAGDLVLVSNGLYNTGGRVVYGSSTNRVVINKAVLVQSVNGPTTTMIGGFLGPPGGIYHPGRCAYLTNGASLVGFALTNGGAANSGDLIHEESGGAIWCETAGAVVSNCIIAASVADAGFGGGAFGGTLVNCVLTNNFAGGGGGSASNTLLNCTILSNSATGALSQGTVGGGGGAYGCTASNCVFVGNSANERSGGGGAAFSFLTNCILSNNTVRGDAGGGGGASFGTAINCLISSNSALIGGGVLSNVAKNCILRNNFAVNGGGAYNSSLFGCTVISNRASNGPGTPSNTGGGVLGGFSFNSIIYDNIAASGSNFYFPSNGVMNYCCTFPLPTNGVGNITNDPAFVNLAGEDFHLQSNSPCINSGNNAYVTSSTDFDGNPRIVGGTVDMGAYEYQTPTSVISYAWLQQYGLPTDGSVDYADLDGTSFNVYQDWIAGLNPTNSTSVLAMQIPVVNTNSTGLTVSWLSVNNRAYYLQRATNLSVQPAFSTIQSNVAGQVGTTTFIDSSATNSGPYFYRVGVQQ